MRAGFDLIDHRRADALGGHIFPVTAAVPGHLDQAVVGANPDDTGVKGRFGEVEYGVVVLRDLVGDRPSHRPLLVLFVARQIGADFGPRMAAVGGFQEDVAGVIDHARVVLRDHDRRVPVKAVLAQPRIDPERQLGIGPDVALDLVLHIHFRNQTEITAGIKEPRIVGIEGHVGGLATADRGKILITQVAVVAPRAHAGRGIVLLAAINPVGELIVDREAVNLGGQLVIDARPGAARIEGHRGAAVVAVDHVFRICRIDPQIVRITMRNRDLFYGFATIDRAVHVRIEDIDRVLVAGIGIDVHIVPGAGVEAPVAIDMAPALAAVVRAVKAALVLGFDNRPDAARLGG